MYHENRIKSNLMFFNLSEEENKNEAIWGTLCPKLILWVCMTVLQQTICLTVALVLLRNMLHQNKKVVKRRLLCVIKISFEFISSAAVYKSNKVIDGAIINWKIHRSYVKSHNRQEFLLSEHLSYCDEFL